jgi:hypothetical protein
MQRWIFNVKVRGFSVGMTFKMSEAQQWKRDSGGEALIIPTLYRV